MKHLNLFIDFLHEDNYDNPAFWYYDIQINTNGHNDKVDEIMKKYSDIIEESGVKDNKRAVIIRCSNKIKVDIFLLELKSAGAKTTKKKIYDKESDSEYNTQF